MRTHSSTQASGSRRLVRGSLAALALAAAVPLLAACVPLPAESDPEAPCSAMPACDVPAPADVEDYDDETYLVEDDADIAELEQLLEAHGIDDDYASSAEVPPGSVTTFVTVHTDSGSFEISTAGGDDGSFDQELHDLVTGWHQSGLFPVAP